MAKRPRELKDLHIKNFKKADEGTRRDEPDTEVRGMSIRVTDRGTKTFVLYTRYPGSTAPARRALGEYGELTLAEARDKARAWKALIKRGIDPRDEEAKQRAAEQRKKKTTFAAVAENFIRDKLPSERSGKDVERELRAALIPALGHRPISDISRGEIRTLIADKKRTAPVAARNHFALLKRLFRWAIDAEIAGVESSPCDSIKTSSLVGPRAARERTLTDDETVALLRCSERLGYPHGTAYRLLVLTALRLNEVADAQWSEFDPAVVRALRQRDAGESVDWSRLDPDSLTWTIPAARMKSKRPHTVPLTGAILALLESVPIVKGAVYLFSSNDGAAPAWMGDKIKKKMDVLMQDELAAIAKSRGEDLAEWTCWRNHDIRRTVRSALSSLRVPTEVSESILAHVRPGIQGVYDKHTYLDEKRDALERWATKLRNLLDPAPSTNVVPLASRR